MSEKLPFHVFLLSAWRASLSKKLPWVFGFLLAVANILENEVSAAFPVITSFQEFLNILSEKSSQTFLFFVLIFIFLFCLEILGKSNLIVSLSFVADKTNLPHHPDNLSSIGKNFFHVFLLECLALLFLLIVIGIFSLPFFIASSQNPEVLDSLSSLGILTFIPIAVAIFFIKQFAAFYLLLSPLKLRAALEASGSLFSRFIFRSLIFGLFSLILTILFTFCVNTIILSLVALSKKIGLPFTDTFIASAIGLVFFAWFSIFQQAFWLAFFKSIAGPKEKEPVAEKAVALDSNTLPEIPPAQ